MSYLFCLVICVSFSCNICLATFHTASYLRIRLNWPVLRVVLVLFGDEQLHQGKYLSRTHRINHCCP